MKWKQKCLIIGAVMTATTWGEIQNNGGSCSKDDREGCLGNDDYWEDEKSKWSETAIGLDKLAPAEAQLSKAVMEHYDTFPNPTFTDIDLVEEEKYYKNVDDEDRAALYPMIHVSLDIVNHYIYGGKQSFEDFRVLVAGGGTGSSLLYLAEQLRHVPSAQLVYLDFSRRSLEIARQRAKFRRLKNIRWVYNSIENIDSIRAELGTFDLIECRHVIEHLVDPLSGLKQLAGLLRDDGAISLSLHADVGRTGLMQMQTLMRIINKKARSRDEEIQNTRKILKSAPTTNWYKRFESLGAQFIYDRSNSEKDMKVSMFTDADIAELFLHKVDRTFRIPEMYELLSNASLELVTHSDYADRLSLKIENYIKFPDLLEKLKQKEVRKQEAVAELMSGILTKHEVLAVKSSRPNTEADFADLSLVPFFFGNPVGLPIEDDGDKFAGVSTISGRVIDLRSGQDDKRLRLFTWPMSAKIRSFIRLVAKNEGFTTGQIIKLISGKDDAESEAIFAELQPFYTAAKESGQLLLRSSSLSPPPPLTGSLYRLEFD